MMAVLLGWTTPAAFAFHPEPGNIYYGIVRAADGHQLGTADGVRLLMQSSRTNVVAGQIRVDTYTVAECDVFTSQAGEPNFILRPSLDGGGGDRYSPLALQTGESVRVLLVVRNGTTNELGGAVPAPAARGTFHPINLAAPCSDADRDGLCDDWELAHFGSLQATDGTIDSDGDGLTDKQEHDGGTNPKNDPPPLVLHVVSAGESGITVEWRRLPGRTYRIDSASNVTDAFVPVPSSRLVQNPGNPDSIEVKLAEENPLFLRVIQQ